MSSPPSGRDSRAVTSTEAAKTMISTIEKSKIDSARSDHKNTRVLLYT